MNADTQTTESTESTGSPAAKTPAKRAAKPAAKRSAKAPAKAAAPKKSSAKLVTKAATTDGIALKTICAKLKIEPKLARRRLRAAKLAWHDPKSRWNLTAKQATQVTELLRSNEE